MKLTVLICAIIIALGALYAGLCIYIAATLTTPGPSPVNFDRKKIGERVADVTFRSKDGFQLAGWYFRNFNDKAIIFVHGAGNENRVNEVYGTPEIAKHFYDAGYTVLLFDLRGTGESQKARSSFGYDEAKDVAGAFSYMMSQDFKPESIGIISDSLGAIAAIMAADDIKKAGGIVLDSPATDVKPIVENIMADEHKVPRLLIPGSLLAAKLLYGIDVNAVKPINKISILSSTPLLFLHGEKDTLIPPDNSKILFEMVKNADRVTFPNAQHVQTYKSDPSKYLDLLDSFFDKNLKT